MNEVISIGRRKSARPLTAAERILSGPVVDKFFLLAAISGFGGTLLLGIYLWAARYGLLPVGEAYLLVRALHAEIQLLVFFSFFIVGFSVQAGPRLLGLQSRNQAAEILVALAAPILGIVLRLWSPTNPISPFLYAMAPLIALHRLFRLVQSASRTPSFFQVLIVSLLFLAFGAFLPIGRADVALFVFWGGVGGAIVGVWHVFIANLLGGRRLTGWWWRTGALLFALSILTLGAWCLDGASELLRMSAGAALGLLLVYAFGTGGAGLRAFRTRPMLALSSLSALCWGLLAWGLIAAAMITADEGLHLLALGFAFPLVFGLSVHIIGHLSGTEPLSTRVACILLGLWQLVPTLRGLSRVVPVTQIMTVVLAAITLSTFLGWIYALVRAERNILMRQMQLREGETMVRD